MTPGQGKKPRIATFPGLFSWAGAVSCLLALVVLTDPANLMRCAVVDLPAPWRTNSAPEEKESEDAGKPILSTSNNRHLARKRTASAAPRKDLAFFHQLASSTTPGFSSNVRHLSASAPASSAFVPLRC